MAFVRSLIATVCEMLEACLRAMQGKLYRMGFRHMEARSTFHGAGCASTKLP